MFCFYLKLLGERKKSELKSVHREYLGIIKRKKKYSTMHGRQLTMYTKMMDDHDQIIIIAVKFQLNNNK